MMVLEVATALGPDTVPVKWTSTGDRVTASTCRPTTRNGVRMMGGGSHTLIRKRACLDADTTSPTPAAKHRQACLARKGDYKVDRMPQVCKHPKPRERRCGANLRGESNASAIQPFWKVSSTKIIMANRGNNITKTHLLYPVVAVVRHQQAAGQTPLFPETHHVWPIKLPQALALAAEGSNHGEPVGSRCPKKRIGMQHLETKEKKFSETR